MSGGKEELDVEDHVLIRHRDTIDVGTDELGHQVVTRLRAPGLRQAVCVALEVAASLVQCQETAPLARGAPTEHRQGLQTIEPEFIGGAHQLTGYGSWARHFLEKWLGELWIVR